MANRAGSVAVLCLVQFVDVKGVTVLMAALPALLRDLGAEPADATLVATGYAAVFGGMLMLGARLGDRFEHRRVLLAGIVLFAVGAAVGATASSVLVVTVARCAQGAAAALTVPAALRLISAAAPAGPARTKALSAWSATGAAAGVTGFLLGGILTDTVGWRAIFAIDVPLAVVLGGLILWTVGGGSPDRAARVELVAGLALTIAVMGLVVGATVVQEHLLPGLVILVASTALALVFRRRRARVPNMRSGAAGAFLNTATTSSAIALATLYLQDEAGATPLTAGLTLLPCSLLAVAGSAAAAPLIRRTGRYRTIMLGLGLIAIGDAMLIALPQLAGAAPVGVGVAGLGLGMASVAATSLSGDVPADDQSRSYGLSNTAAQLGTALGTAAILLVAAVTGSVTGWACAAAVAAAGSLAALYRGSTRFDRTSASVSG